MRARRHFRGEQLEPLELEPRQPAHVVYEQRLREAFELRGATLKQRAQLAGLAVLGRLVSIAAQLAPFLVLWALWALFSWVSP